MFNLQLNKPNVILYILCYNEETLQKALKKYKYYYWAKPILIKTQSILFENEFYSQLLDMKHEWINCAMVGTLSHRAFEKINIGKINSLIEENYKKPYYHFYRVNRSLRNEEIPEAQKKIIHELLDKWKIKDTTCQYCNYWMCKPKLMILFIEWLINDSIPYLKKNPLCFEDSKYIHAKSLTEEQLIQLWGKPYYPNLPFVLERINPLFFNSSSTLSFLS